MNFVLFKFIVVSSFSNISFIENSLTGVCLLGLFIIQIYSDENIPIYVSVCWSKKNEFTDNLLLK